MQSAMLWLCVAAASVVFGLMLYSVTAYRSPPGSATPRRPARLLVEVIWAAVPIVIIVTAALPTMRQLLTSAPPLN